MKLEIVKVPYNGKNKCEMCHGKKYLRYINIGEYEENIIVNKCHKCGGTGKSCS